MDTILLFAPIVVPFAGSLIALVAPRRLWGKEITAVAAALIALLATLIAFGRPIVYTAPWCGFGFDLTFRLHHVISFTTFFASAFAFVIALYAAVFMRGRPAPGQFWCWFLVSLGVVNGAVLADNLVLMLFFWEGYLIALFGLIAIGGRYAFKTATKMFIIVGLSDLVMMAGIILAGHLAGTYSMSAMRIPLGGLGTLSFLLIATGAVAKAGAVPFHTWIPDAATDAPLPFMAYLPAALEKLLGIYLLIRVTLDLFDLTAASRLSGALMALGSATLIIAVMMALVQRDYKRLLSYHAVSQVGYMILGIGTMVPAGIVGGIFHMINNAVYKSCLFLTAGSVEKQAGTTDLAKLGGLMRRMPVTFIVFFIAAASISGVPPFNGFFSKELIAEGALQRGLIFYVIAEIGKFLTAASFLKLGHAAFLDKPRGDRSTVRESPLLMLLPMIVLACVCILFGVWNSLPVNGLIEPILGKARLAGHHFSGLPKNPVLIAITIAVLLAALANHLYGFRKTGSGLAADDHIHYAPLLKGIYARAEQHYFDPYDIGRHAARWGAKLAWWCDRANDWLYNVAAVKAAETLSAAAHRLQNGDHKSYLAWTLLAAGAVITLLIKYSSG